MAITTLPPSPNTRLSVSLFGLRVYNDLVALDAAINSASRPKGILFAASNTSNVTAGGETMASSPATNFNWQAGRAYRITLTGRASGAVANVEFIPKLKRGTTIGASTLADFGSLKIPVSGNIEHVNFLCYVANFTGVDVVQTVQPSITGGGGNTTWDGGTIPRGWTIEDIGLASTVGGLAAQI